MEIENNLVEFEKYMLISINKGIDIYRSKLSDERQKFDQTTDVFSKIISKAKENFIYNSAKIDLKYSEIKEKIDKVQNSNLYDISFSTNEINSQFCLINKDFTDLINVANNNMIKELLEEINKFSLLEMSSSQFGATSLPKSPNKDRLLSNIQNVSSNQIEKSYIDNEINSNNNSNIIYNGEKQNLKEFFISSPRSPHNRNNPNKNQRNEKNHFFSESKNINIMNNNEFYFNSNLKPKAISSQNFPVKGNPQKEVSQINDNNILEKDWGTSCTTNFEISHWGQEESFQKKSNINIEEKTQDNNIDINDTSNLVRNPNQNDRNIVNLEDEKSEKFLNKKRANICDSDNSAYNRFNNIQTNMGESNLMNESKDHKSFRNSHNFLRNQKISNNSNSKELSYEDTDIAKKLSKKFPEYGWNFINIVEYLKKNKILKSFEFNLTNSKSVSQQIENFLIENSFVKKNDYSILLKILTKHEECNVKSSLSIELNKMFVHRCMAFKQDYIYIGGVCNMGLRDLFYNITQDSFMKTHKILNVTLSLYNFFEDIMNDLDDIKPSSISYNLTKPELKEKKSKMFIIKNIRKEYENLVTNLNE